jgi:hypothetical protein
MSINSHLSTCVGTQSPKYLEMAQGHISLSDMWYVWFILILFSGSEVMLPNFFGPASLLWV